MSVWLSTLCIVWLLNVVRYLSMAFEGIREWTQRTSVKARVLLLAGVRLLVEKFVELPESSEALLRAEVSGWQFQFNACWALHSSLFSAVRGSAGILVWLFKLNVFLLSLLLYFLVCVFGGFHHFNSQYLI